MMNKARPRTEVRIRLSRVFCAAGMVTLLLWGQTAPLLANPTGGTVVSGNSSIGTSGSTETITQTSKNSIINWQTFSINGGETTKFIVPNSQSATLNRVTGGNVSSIYGTLESNGKIILINPNGVMVGPNGRIDTSSFLGSTLDVSNEQFLKGGNLDFLGTGGSITNDGTITATNGGVYLIATQVTNNGSISAAKGDVGLAAGTDVLFQQQGDQHLFVQADNSATPRATGVTQAGTVNAAAAELKAAGGNAYALAINNTGQINATGYKKINGQVILTGETGAVENSGSIRATTGKRGGRISLLTTTGGIVNSGVLDASATGAGSSGGHIMLKSTEDGSVSNTALAQLDARGGDGGKGGNVEISGGQVQALGLVDTTAVNGTTGMFTIDPATFTVAASGGDETGAQVAATLATTNLTLNADNAVNIDDAITWTSTSTLTLSTNVAGSTISINSPISGVNGGLTINAAASTDLILPNAAVNVSNFILQNGYWEQNFTALPAFSATHDFEIQGSSTFLRAAGGAGTAQVPYRITDVYGLQGLGSPSGLLLGSSAILENNIDASGTATWNNGAGFVPIGTQASNYTGTFNGQGNVITGLNINQSSGQFVGLFGYAGTGSVVENLGVENVNVLGNYHVGALIGEGDGTVLDCFSTGTVTGSNSANAIGGLIGSNGGSLTDSYSGADVSTQGTSDQLVAGLVGINYFGTIQNCYAYGSVSSPGNIFAVGGLVGNNVGGTITNTYSSGAVNGGGGPDVGGLVGYNSGTITGSFWDTTTAGTGVVSGVGSDSTPNTTAGVTGDTTSVLLQESTYAAAGWSIGTDLTADTWVIINGQTRPMLSMEYGTTITNGHQLQLVGLNASTLTANYTLGGNIDLTGTSNASDIWGTSTTNGGGGFAPIGTFNGNSDAQGVVYHGIFNGQGYTINGLYINTPNSDYVALFGDSGNNTTIENVNLTNVNVTGSTFVAGLVAVADSTFNNDSSAGTVTGNTYVGGLLGNVFGSVNTSFTSGTVNGSGNSYDVGGLAGLVQGGTMDSCYSTATVSALNAFYVGGLIGENEGAVTNVYSTGSVQGLNYVGGLAGSNGGTIGTSYTVSPVSSTGAAGGFVGSDGGTITESFWDIQTAGVTVGAPNNPSDTGIMGATTAELTSQSYILSQAPNWNFTTVWTTNGGTTTPQLLNIGTNQGGGGTPDMLTGTVYIDSGATDAAGVTLDFLYDGTLLGTTTTDGSGQYTFTISSTDLTGGLLITDAVDHGNTYFQSNSPQTTNTGVDLFGSTLRVLSDAASNAGLATAAGGLTGAGINYAVSGSHLTTNAGINMSVLGTYTLDGNITSAGEFSTATGSHLLGSANVTVSGSSVALSGTFDRTGSTTFTSTTGGIDLEGVGNVDTAAVSQGLTLTSAQNLTINNSYIDLNGGNFSATGTGYASSVDGNGNVSGIDITTSTIQSQGGNVTLTGIGGYGNFGSGGIQTGDALFINGSTLSTTGAGNLTLTGTFNHNINSVTGIYASEIYGSTLSVGAGALSVSGVVQQGTGSGLGAGGSGIYGLIIGQSSTVEATGSGGSVSLTGNTAGSTTLVSDGNSDENQGLFLGRGTYSVATNGTLTLSGTSGTINATNSTATGANAPFSVGLQVANTASITAGDSSTVSITGIGGAVQSSGAYTGDSYGVVFVNSSVSMGNGGSMTLTGHAGAVNAGVGTNAADATSVGIQLDASTFSLTNGAITMTGTGGALDASQAGTLQGNVGAVSRGILIFDGALVQGLGTTTLALTGTGGNVTSGTTLTGGSVGVDFGGNGSGVLTQVTTDTGTITIIGTGGTAPSFGDGVLFSAFNGGQTDVSSTSGNIAVTGTGGAGYNGGGSIVGNSIPNYGVLILDNVQVNTGGRLSFTGTAGHNTSGGTNSDAVEIEELINDPTFDSSPTLPVINAANGLNVTSTYGGVDLGGTATSNYSTTITTPGSSSSTIENSGGPYTLNGGSYSLTGNTADVAGGTMGNLTIDVTGNIAFGTLTAGTVTLTAGSAITQTGSLHASELAVTSAGDVALTNTGNAISTLGDISSGSNIDIYTDPGLVIAGLVSGDGDITIQEKGGNLTLSSGGQVLDVGEGNNITLVTNKSFINNSSFGSGAVSSQSGNYYVYAGSPTGSSLGGLPVDFTLYNTAYPASGLPPGNGIIYASSASGTPPSGPGTLPGGGTPVPPAIVPQTDQIAPQQAGSDVLAQTTPQNSPYSTSGNGIFTTTAADSGDLADFYGNSGQIGSNDAAQLNNGELNNVTDPAAAGALDQALSPAVHSTLQAAMNAVQVVTDSNTADQGNGKTTGNGKLLGGGDVVEISAGSVKQIPASQAPPPLKNALGNGVRNGLQPGAGH